MWQVIHGWAGLTILISCLMSILGIVLAAIMIVRMPEDYFLEDKKTRKSPQARQHLLWIIFKNVVGAAMIILGIAMIILPGPGILAILLGLSYMDVPGKHALLYLGLRLKSVRRSLNWVRRRFGHPAFTFPPQTLTKQQK